MNPFWISSIVFLCLALIVSILIVIVLMSKGTSNNAPKPAGAPMAQATASESPKQTEAKTKPKCCDVQTVDQTYKDCTPCKLPSCPKVDTLIPTQLPNGDMLYDGNPEKNIVDCLMYGGIFVNGCNDPRAYGLKEKESYKTRCDVSCGQNYMFKGVGVCTQEDDQTSRA